MRSRCSAEPEAKGRFFKTFSDWYKWLEKNHASTPELWVGFHKKSSGRASITWPESVDGALCFGWIDGIRKSIDAISHRIVSSMASSKRGSRRTIGLGRFSARRRHGIEGLPAIG